MTNLVRVVFLSLVFVPLAIPTQSWATGSRTKAVRLTPQEQANKSYRSGSKALEKAIQYESQLASESSPKNRTKLTGKMNKSFQGAAKKFAAAVKSNYQMYQAHADLGYSRHRLGDYEGALRAYDRALELSPNYAKARKNRAEAHMELGQLEKAKEAYGHLLDDERPVADALLVAMTEWVSNEEVHPDSLDPKSLAEFADWVQQH